MKDKDCRDPPFSNQLKRINKMRLYSIPFRSRIFSSSIEILTRLNIKTKVVEGERGRESRNKEVVVLAQ